MAPTTTTKPAISAKPLPKPTIPSPPAVELEIPIFNLDDDEELGERGYAEDEPRSWEGGEEEDVRMEEEDATDSGNESKVRKP